MKTIKVYTHRVSMHTPEGWKKYSVKGSSEADFFEIAYIEYDETGRVVSTGTEDFSIERLKNAGLKVGGYHIQKASGEKTKAGLTKWDTVKFCRISVKAEDFGKGVKFWKKQFEGLKVTAI